MGRQPSKDGNTTHGRHYYLDNFRIYLTAIVIYHHTAVAYGGSGKWFYESKYHSPGSSGLLVTFNAVNQSYFMASFFFLSGLMSARAMKRKYVGQFLLTKYVKLGIPVIIYTLFGHPAQIALQRIHNQEQLGINIVTEYWATLRGVHGPVWYSALLLIFDTMYCLIPISALIPTSFPFGLPQFLPGIILLIRANLAIRLWYLIGKPFLLLNLEPGYLLQYIASYLLGTRYATFDSRPNESRLSTYPNSTPLPHLSRMTRNILLVASLVSSASILGFLHYYPGIYSPFGGKNVFSLLYAIWNETTGYILGSSLIRLFSISPPLNRSWGSVGRYSYAAFLVHPIVCVGIQIWTDDWEATGVLKTLVNGSAGVIGSWSVGWALVRVPGARKVVA